VLVAVVAAGCGGDSEADDVAKAYNRGGDGRLGHRKANGNKASLTSQGGAWLIASEP
jgi:hypothetical protein